MLANALASGRALTGTTNGAFGVNGMLVPTLVVRTVSERCFSDSGHLLTRLIHTLSDCSRPCTLSMGVVLESTNGARMVRHAGSFTSADTHALAEFVRALNIGAVRLALSPPYPPQRAPTELDSLPPLEADPRLTRRTWRRVRWPAHLQPRAEQEVPAGHTQHAQVAHARSPPLSFCSPAAASSCAQRTSRTSRPSTSATRAPRPRYTLPRMHRNAWCQPAHLRSSLCRRLRTWARRLSSPPSRSPPAAAAAARACSTAAEARSRRPCPGRGPLRLGDKSTRPVLPSCTRTRPTPPSGGPSATTRVLRGRTMSGVREDGAARRARS